MQFRVFSIISWLATVALTAGPVSYGQGSGMGLGFLPVKATALNQSCFTNVRIMPLGDSITAGEDKTIVLDPPEDPADKQAYWIGYRKPLWDLLAADYPEITFNFVGSLMHGTSYAGFDPNNEGHEGWTDDAVGANVYTWLEDNPADFVLLHIGTNGLETNSDDVEFILEEIDRYEADNDQTVKVVVAKIINRDSYSQATTDFNNAVAAMVSARPDYLTDLFLVDMEEGAGLIYTLQPAGDMSDNLHPYATGYEKMAVVWKAAVDDLLQMCNIAPFVTDPGDQINKVGDSVNLPIEATDPEGDNFSYEIAGQPAGLSIDPDTGVISGTIAGGAPMTYSVTVTVEDDGWPQPESSQVSFDWNVTPNQKPLVFTPPSQVSAEGTTGIHLQIQADDPDGDNLTYTATGLPDDLSIGLTTGLITGTISFEASSSDPYDVVVTVKDDRVPQQQESVSFQWTVTDTNRPPTVTNPGNRSSSEGQEISLPILAGDPDHDQLTFEGEGLPPGLDINPSTGLISGQLSFNSSTGKPYRVEITVTDDGTPVLKNSVVFYWTVSNENGPPVLINPGNRSNKEGDVVSLPIQVSEPDGEQVTFLASGLPPGLSLNPMTGVVSGVIGFDAFRGLPYQVQITASDNLHQQAVVSFTWDVQDRPAAFLPIVTK